MDLYFQNYLLNKFNNIIKHYNINPIIVRYNFNLSDSSTIVTYKKIVRYSIYVQAYSDINQIKYKQLKKGNGL